MKNFHQTDLYTLTDNPFKLLDKEWMLVTAKADLKTNTMTASWGGFGILWNKPVAFVFIRPQRFTFEFIEHSERLSLSFFAEDYRAALKLCGSKSGRDTNKIEDAGLTLIELPTGSPGFKEARIMMDCRKLFFTDLSAGTFIDKNIQPSVYPTSDFHRLYIGEIEACWKNNIDEIQTE
ncbi:flavin reductase family protein [Williamwhitmania taraxaci]|uniref:NADH-FMN oxidoreductase RutF, flavin reductase (DIM6/NTAB) family n=1 Tax=Williamwhitmania taraxaci TaxID=1640674 RepID=A0A1G6HP34_9BACT|nr:flavin reductase family protein [Williamwhitmania taraxaci]SDB95625.1 NADH-FMN oxidoreductase RutF, flavin reductase (DIM6/NTAB) family [Williamwhitmania taraxaci]